MRTTSTSRGFGTLQMVLEPDTRRCANEEAGPHAVCCDSGETSP